MINLRISKRKLLVGAVFLSLFLFAGLRIHIRVQNTIIGYDLGRLKAQEIELLQQRSLLKMELAKLTTKTHLLLASNQKDDLTNSRNTFARK
ncbi:MAG: hypothetical protein R3B45_10655 [Bdellovibrionota bacterium]